LEREERMAVVRQKEDKTMEMLKVSDLEVFLFTRCANLFC